MKFEVFKYSNIGSRYENEDSLNYSEVGNFGIACVADGVGGSGCGKNASSTSVTLFIEKAATEKNDLVELIRNIHLSIRRDQNRSANCKNMATTLTACLITSNHLRGVHLGDTRLYILRENGIKQLTIDHTEVSRLFRSGKITKDDISSYPRKNIIESAIGMHDDITIQEFDCPLLLRDRILLTTDGIHNLFSKAEFRDLSVQNSNLDEFGAAIVNALNNKKIDDNASFIAIQV